MTFLSLLRGTSLCSGELHPDNVLHKEQSLKASKKAYHVHIRKYHNEYGILFNYDDIHDTVYTSILMFLLLTVFLPHICGLSCRMIGNLQAWKEKWLISNDPELDVVQKMWR